MPQNCVLKPQGYLNVSNILQKVRLDMTASKEHHTHSGKKFPDDGGMWPRALTFNHRIFYLEEAIPDNQTCICCSRMSVTNSWPSVKRLPSYCGIGTCWAELPANQTPNCQRRRGPWTRNLPPLVITVKKGVCKATGVTRPCLHHRNISCSNW